jgi:hypothetical protein
MEVCLYTWLKAFLIGVAEADSQEVKDFDKDWKLHTSLEVKLKFDQRGRL